MSDNPPLSPSDRNSVDAPDVGDKLKSGQYDDNSKLRRPKPAITAPKPRLRTTKSQSDEDSVLKNFNEVLDKEDEGSNVRVKEPGTDGHVDDVAASVTNVEGCVADDECMASPAADNVTDKEKPLSENVPESPVYNMDSKTNESRGSLLEHIIDDTTSSVTDQNGATRDRSSIQVQCESVMHCHSTNLVYYY